MNPDETWRYIWDTNDLVGRLIPSSYTVYIVNLPLGLPHTGSVSVARTNVTSPKIPDPGISIDAVPLGIDGMRGVGLLFLCRRKGWITCNWPESKCTRKDYDNVTERHPLQPVLSLFRLVREVGPVRAMDCLV